MLQLRKQSQTSVDSFTVFDDSQLDNSGAFFKPEVEKRSIEVQTDLQLSDAQTSTDLSIPAKEDEKIPKEPSSTLNQTEFWMAAATVKAAKLDQTRRENDLIEDKIWENKKLNESLQEEYDQLYEKLKARLGEE